MEVKTTIPGLKFVAGKLFLSRWFAEFFIDSLTVFMSTDMDLGRLPLSSIELSDWIKRLEKLELGAFDFSPWKGLRGIHKLSEFLHRLRDDGAFAESLSRQTKLILPPDALDRIKENLDRSAFDEVNRLCTEALHKAGGTGTFDVVGLLAITRAAQTGYRCLARYRVSPIKLIEQARAGDRKAVLTLIKLDKLFLRDICTRDVLQRALLSADSSFNNQVARAQMFKLEFSRRDACEIYMILLASLQIRLPPIYKLRTLLDPDCTTFQREYAFEKCFERIKKRLSV